MINPMTSRTYQGYIRADQSPVEEENEMEEQDLESGQRSRGSSSVTNKPVNTTAGAGGRVKGTESSSLRPNIRRGDEDKREDSSDDEVPQSFIIETPTARTNAALNRASSSSSKGKGRAKSSDTSARTSGAPQRSQPLHSVAGRRVPPSGPILPVSVQDDNVRIPPRPSELDEEEHVTMPSGASNSGESSGAGGTRRQVRGTMGRLDSYERALWNWVNVYNLDAFLQEVYYYYEGKGIYSIALARGLNLLLVFFFSGSFRHVMCFMTGQWGLSLGFQHFCWDV